MSMKSSQESKKRSSCLPEFLFFAFVLTILNFPLLRGSIFESAIFLPECVKAGEWWRVVTHPFVHLSWYHLLLDAGAFLLLYGGLDEPSRLRRILYAVGCGLGSLILSSATSSVIGTQGLCGLSGIAHGLMAVSALESMKDKNAGRTSHLTGMISFVIVVAKSIAEVLMGQVFFEFLHFGLMGLPVPACHAGGVMSGILLFLAMGRVRGATNDSRGARAFKPVALSGGL